MNKKAIITVALTLMSGATFAAAPAFEDVDANKDGKISKEEATAIEGLDWAKADANGDGELDMAEYKVVTEE